MYFINQESKVVPKCFIIQQKSDWLKLLPDVLLALWFSLRWLFFTQEFTHLDAYESWLRFWREEVFRAEIKVVFQVTTGPFANWETRQDIQLSHLSPRRKIVRALGESEFGGLYRESDVQNLMRLPAFRDLTYCVNPHFELVHGTVHMWVSPSSSILTFLLTFTELASVQHLVSRNPPVSTRGRAVTLRITECNIPLRPIASLLGTKVGPRVAVRVSQERYAPFHVLQLNTL